MTSGGITKCGDRDSERRRVEIVRRVRTRAVPIAQGVQGVEMRRNSRSGVEAFNVHTVTRQAQARGPAALAIRGFGPAHLDVVAMVFAKPPLPEGEVVIARARQHDQVPPVGHVQVLRMK